MGPQLDGYFSNAKKHPGQPLGLGSTNGGCSKDLKWYGMNMAGKPNREKPIDGRIEAELGASGSIDLLFAS